MPTLIVEDGSGVENANTYIDEAYLTTYASDRGLSVPTTTQAQQQAIIAAMDYLTYFTDQWAGTRTADAQALPWPRESVYIDNVEQASDAIPEDLKKAQAQLVVEKNRGTLLFPEPLQSATEGLVIENTVGPLTKKFAFTGKGTANPLVPIKIASVWAYLDKLTGISSNALLTYRI